MFNAGKTAARIALSLLPFILTLFGTDASTQMTAPKVAIPTVASPTVAAPSIAPTPTAPTLSADEIIDKMLLQVETQTEQVQVNMKLLNAKGVSREADRTFRMQAIHSKNHDFKALLTFLLPVGIKNTKVLTIKTGETTSQWIYLPSAKRVSRINSDEDVEGVLDSDLAYSDLKAESKEEFRYSLNSQKFGEYAEKVCGEPAYSVMAVAKEGHHSSYDKRILGISKQKFIVCSVLVYDKQNRMIKTILNQNFQNVGGNWRPSLTTISSFKDGTTLSSKTVLNYSGWKTKVSLDPALFSVNNLEQ